MIHYPYGDWTRPRLDQLREIGSDLWNNAHRKSSRYGGKRLTASIEQVLKPGQKLLLIGHSAGAVASIQAADTLLKAGRTIIGVVQIGSPKCAVPSSLSHRVLYLNGVNTMLKPVDPIPRIGTWGGWSAARFGLKRWNHLKQAPFERKPLPLIGGHADYFRDHHPYIWNESTNLQTTLNAIWTWLQLNEKEDEYD
ncbi:alpha/beta hydrolase [Paenibacillus sp. N3.4]|uniref:alpha/beta hydrolase n=1 Tax=Paenibacillus sp. N3.4 TaxID=2603222 RepID=UPI0011C908A2|nr:alpha/beta hydrolase [Paenibacillus sp. N3.4]TXK70270.1 hypothetical protein FU659_33580 [Paenibacillus sp. N3.4]